MLAIYRGQPKTELEILASHGQLNWNNTCFINQLPDEMLAEIFKKLCHIDAKAIVKLRRCCRRWNAMLRSTPFSRKQLFIDITSGSLFLHLLHREGANLKIICPRYTEQAVWFTRGPKIVHDLDALFSTGSFIRDCKIRQMIYSYLEFNMISFCELLITLGLFEWNEEIALEFHHCELRLSLGYISEAPAAPLHGKLEFGRSEAAKMSTEDMYYEFLNLMLRDLRTEELMAIHDLLRGMWRFRGGLPWAKAMARILNRL